jgi:hypothetical protein
VIWSPDGTLLAFFSRDNDAADGTINVIPAIGGTARVVTKVEAIYANKEMYKRMHAGGKIQVFLKFSNPLKCGI